MDSKPSNRAGLAIWIGLGLSALTLIAFWPVGHLGFINLDDYGKDGYVVDNVNVQAGMTLESLRWAFTTAHASNWHPITWLSHMLDCRLFGLNPGGPHWVNLGIHGVNTLLLFIVLRRLTRTMWRSALAAALFALHPLRVESVAWISERKDVLSGFFFLLTLWAWVRYAQAVTRGKCQVTDTDKADPATFLTPVLRHPTRFYWLALVFFAMGLMTKPMLVTLPLVLLLLDIWPLRRVAGDEWRVTRSGVSVPRLASLQWLLWEKLPFWGLSLASGMVTVWAQVAGGSVIPLERLSWGWRMENSLIAYVIYIGKVFWPRNLAVIYPYGYTQTSLPRAAGCALLLLLMTAFCLRQMRRQPCWLVGWCWFVVMLLPVIGLVQVGTQSMADRYTYLPSIGLFILVAWGLAGVASRSQLWRNVTILAATAMLLGSLLVTRHQLRFWRDGVTLFSHALAVTGENRMGNYFLANAYWVAGNLDEAGRNYQAILRTVPDSEDMHYRLGYIRLQQKFFDAAGVQFKEVLRINPRHANAHMCLGSVRVAEGDYAGAAAEFSAALQLRPGDAVITGAVAAALERIGSEPVLAGLSNRLESMPTPETHLRVAVLQTARGDFPDAMAHCQAALRLDPDAADVLNYLAWLWAACPDEHLRDGAQAVQLAERACKLTGYKQAGLVGTLAAAYAQAGRFAEAQATAQQACRLASDAGEPDLVERNRASLELFRRRQSYREAATP